MKPSDHPSRQHSPAPVIGTPEEQSTHRPPAPAPAEHNAARPPTPSPAADYANGAAIRDGLLSTSHGIR